MKIGKSILDKKSNAVSPPKAQDGKQLEKFLEKRRKRRTEDTEENIKYKMPTDEGDATDADLIKQNEELAREKHAFSTRHDVQLDDTEKNSDESNNGGKSENVQ
jgi:hypothetical protein